MTLTEVVKILDIQEHEFIRFTIDKNYQFKEDIQVCNIRKLLDMSALEITKIIPCNDYGCNLHYYIMAVHFKETKCKNNEKLKANLIKRRKDNEEYYKRIARERAEYINNIRRNKK